MLSIFPSISFRAASSANTGTVLRSWSINSFIRSVVGLPSAAAFIRAELFNIVNMFAMLKSIRYTLSFMFTYFGSPPFASLTFFTYLVHSLNMFWSYSWGEWESFKYIILSTTGNETPVRNLLTVNIILFFPLSSSLNSSSFSSPDDILFPPTILNIFLSSVSINELRSFSIALHAAILGSTINVCLHVLLPSTFLLLRNANLSSLPLPNNDFIKLSTSGLYKKSPLTVLKSAPTSVPAPMSFSFVLHSLLSFSPILRSVGMP